MSADTPIQYKVGRRYGPRNNNPGAEYVYNLIDPWGRVTGKYLLVFKHDLMGRSILLKGEPTKERFWAAGLVVDDHLCYSVGYGATIVHIW